MKKDSLATKHIPIWGRDEMNLVELPFGPITTSTTKTLDVVHSVYDAVLKREVTRRTLITGSDAYGLPRPVDDQVLIGLKALTHESGNQDRKIFFSRYHLCQVIGWKPDGRSYQRLDDSFNRIAGTMLKFKDAWWDKGEKEWKSKTFHLIDEVELCSRDRLDRKRLETGKASQKLCYFVWNEVVWKSFQDGFIKALDMDLFRRISNGKRRDVPVRLFRILDKKLHKRRQVTFKVQRLAVGILGLSPKYSPSQMIRILERAAKILIGQDFLASIRILPGPQEPKIEFTKASPRRPAKKSEPTSTFANRKGEQPDPTLVWLRQQSEADLSTWEAAALEADFGSPLERQLVRNRQTSDEPIMQAGPIRRGYLFRYVAAV